jgi:hypothetical protein
MCLQDTELDKLLRNLDGRIKAVEARTLRLEEGHNQVPSWLHTADVADRYVGHPKFLREIELFRKRLFDLDVRLTMLEDHHPELRLIDWDTERHE